MEPTTTTTTTGKDFVHEASGLFGNIRIPAALFAGASAGAAYAMPVTAVADSLLLGFAKRLYGVLMIHALASQIVTIVVGTMAMANMAGRNHGVPQFTNLSAWIRHYYYAEWTTVKFQFITGILAFSTASGVRAWVTMGCPVMATVSVGGIVSATLLSMAFGAELERKIHGNGGMSFWKMPLEQVRVLYNYTIREGGNPLFLAGLVCYLATLVYAAVKIPHLYHYLAAATAATATATAAG